jgi:hypothetical protein
LNTPGGMPTTQRPKFISVCERSTPKCISAHCSSPRRENAPQEASVARCGTYRQASMRPRMRNTPCPSARSVSPRALNRLTRRRGDAKAERERRAYVGRDCIRRRKQAPRDPGTRRVCTARADGRNHCLSRHQSGHGMPCPNTPTPTIIAYRIISGRCTRFIAGETRATAMKSA